LRDFGDDIAQTSTRMSDSNNCCNRTMLGNSSVRNGRLTTMKEIVMYRFRFQKSFYGHSHFFVRVLIIFDQQLFVRVLIIFDGFSRTVIICRAETKHISITIPVSRGEQETCA